MTEKTNLRTRFRTLRDAIPPAVRSAHSAIICRKALSLVRTLHARSVFVYLSMGSEVETHNLIQTLLQQGVTVSVPSCNTLKHTMDAVRFSDDLIPDSYGILTPRSKEVLPPSAIDLVLVPALAFDREGYRLGYGGGYYDRYLKHFTNPTAGLGYSVCMTDRLPRGNYDCKVSMVLTEER